jgi:preprotein translocase subunit YajC
MLISSAYAAGEAATPSLLEGMFPFAVIFVLFYFILLRPQLKQAKAQRAMLAELKKGDEVATASGIIGKVDKINNEIVSLEIAAGVVINVQKQSVQAKLEKGTIKS